MLTGNRKGDGAKDAGRSAGVPRRRRHAALILAAAWLALIALAGPSARAAGPDKRELNARVDFAAGRYEKALEAYAQLYAETLNPIYLRNIGRCDQMMKKPQEAINSFREYLRKGKNLSLDERQEIEGFIREMEALESSQARRSGPAAPPAVAPAPPEESPSKPVSVPAPAPAPAVTPVAVTPVVAPSAGPATPAAAEPPLSSPPTIADGSPRGGGGQRAAGVALIAGGGALAGLGAVFGWRAHDAATSVEQQYDPDRASRGQRDQTIEWVAYSAAAVAVGSGVLLYWHGAHAGSAPPRSSAASRAPVLSAATTLDGRGGTVLLRGEF